VQNSTLDTNVLTENTNPNCWKWWTCFNLAFAREQRPPQYSAQGLQQWCS